MSNLKVMTMQIDGPQRVNLRIVVELAQQGSATNRATLSSFICNRPSVAGTVL